MAQGSGGFRPTAPQNNFGVSATGGAGNSGKQPIRVAAGGKYGQRTALVQQQQGAPMAAAQPSMQNTQPSAPAPTAPQRPLVPLFAPTQRPNEHVTAGAPGGTGAVVSLPNPVQSQYGTAYDMFQAMASQPGASPSIQYLAQKIKEGY